MHWDVTTNVPRIGWIRARCLDGHTGHPGRVHTDPTARNSACNVTLHSHVHLEGVDMSAWMGDLQNPELMYPGDGGAPMLLGAAWPSRTTVTAELLGSPSFSFIRREGDLLHIDASPPATYRIVCSDLYGRTYGCELVATP
jgi:hypothetical protein